MNLHIDKAEFVSWKESGHSVVEGLEFDKVIFLDIDGVLNDEGYNYRKGVIVDGNMVNRLAEIVKETEAQIILSSSWRLNYLQFVEADYRTEDKELIILDKMFTDAGLSVRGITPITSWSGPSSRPAEICDWLDKVHVTSYAILDDDDFWMWEKYGVASHVVLTKKKRGYDFIRGLSNENVIQAIKVLNVGA